MRQGQHTHCVSPGSAAAHGVTAWGVVYLLCVQGNTLPGWPVQMGEVQGQVLVADLNADGKMEIFAGVGVCIAGTYNLSRKACPGWRLFGSLVLGQTFVSVGWAFTWGAHLTVVAWCDTEAVLWPVVCVHLAALR